MEVKSKIEKAKKFLFKVFLGNEDIKNSNLKKSFTRLFIISISIILGCMIISLPFSSLKLGWGFQEGRPVTWLSFFQLLIVGFISWEIYLVRSESNSQNKNIKMWYYLSILFIYLGFDDLCRLHESIDHRLCDIFGWDKHGPADKIDDYLVVLYGLIGLYILLKNTKESIKFLKTYKFMIAAMLLSITSAVCDIAGGRDSVFSNFYVDEELTFVLRAVDIIEETAKAMAEVFFVGAFLNMYYKFKNREIE